MPRMVQLSLFDDRDLAPEPALPAGDVALPGEGVPAGQLDLFAGRTLRLSLANEAIAAGRLDEALRLLGELTALQPADAEARRLSERVAALQRKLQRAERSASPAAALLEAARGLDPAASGAFASLRRALWRRVAEALRNEAGDDGRLEGQPPGHYWLLAGDAAEAHASLANAAQARRCARTLFLLADAATLLGEPTARRLYLEALLRDPFDAALAAARDEAVRGLPDVARYELEIEDEPAAWSAPVGIVTGVLPPPIGIVTGVLPPPIGIVMGVPPQVGLALGEPARKGLGGTAHEAPGGPAQQVSGAPGHEVVEVPRSPGQAEALARARRFVAALVEASSREARRSGDAVIEARRVMKRLAPTLFAAYMARGGGALHGP